MRCPDWIGSCRTFFVEAVLQLLMLLQGQAGLQVTATLLWISRVFSGNEKILAWLFTTFDDLVTNGFN